MRAVFFLALVTSALGQVSLPPVVVTAARDEAPSALTGEKVGWLYTPRAAIAIDAAQLSAYNARLPDLGTFDASVQAGGTYGHTATVNVRGDMAELYQNGQRRTNNAAGFQPSFNGVEGVDIVKGPASVVFGPGFYSGGYLNLRTKRATGVPATSYAMTVGGLSADHSYLDVTGAVDDNRPLTPTMALRVSYEGRRDATFYRAGRDDAQDLFVTLHSGALDLSLQYLWQAIPQIEGVNRVTQDLVWTRLYDSDKGLTLLRPTDNLVSPGDFSNANVVTGQATYTRGAFRSLTLIETVTRRRFNAFSYAEYARQVTVDQRIEWHRGGLVAGIEGRYERRESFTNYFNAFFDAYDITLSNPRDATTLLDYAVGHPGPGGRLFFGPLDGNTDTTLSRLYQGATFAQHRAQVAPNLQLLTGVRLDGYRVFVEDPLTHGASDSLTIYSVSRTASLIWTRDNWSAYLTYARLFSVNGTVSGGGIVLAPDLRINKGNLRSLNRLYEAGLRRETPLGQASFTLFRQERQQPDLYAYAPNDIVVRGAEMELTLRRGVWSRSVSATYADANYVHSQPFEFATSLPAASAPGDYRVPGLSRLYVVTTFGYQGARWGTALTPRWQSEQAGDALDAYHIPAQYALDAQVSYRRGAWSAIVNVRNVTNRWNWVHNGDAFGDNVVIHHEPLLNASLTLRYVR